MHSSSCWECWQQKSFRWVFLQKLSYVKEQPHTRSCLLLVSNPHLVTGQSWEGIGNQLFFHSPCIKAGQLWKAYCLWLYFWGWQMPVRTRSSQALVALVPWLQTTSVTLLWDSLDIPEKPQDMRSFLYSLRQLEKKIELNQSYLAKLITSLKAL